MLPYIKVNQLNMPMVQGSNISINIAKGELIGITGISGCGKSTFAKYLAGILRPETLGQLIVSGLDPYSQLDREKLRRISGIVYQDPTEGIVFENIGRDIVFGLENQGVSVDKIKQRAALYMNAYDLNGTGRFGYTTVSGGTKQRAALACVLMTGPELLILDEAMTMQDNEAADRFMNRLIRTSRNRGTTLIVFSKKKSVLTEMDRVYELKDGQLYEIDADAMPIGSYEDREIKAQDIKSSVRVSGHNNILIDRYITGNGYEQGITLRNISYGYGKVMLYDRVNYRFEGGSAYRISGASGSGKTTFLQIIAGLVKPIEGEVFMSEQAKIGYVFQYSEDGFVEGTVLDDVMFGPISDGHPKKVAREMAQSVLKFVGVDEALWMRSPLKLSVGQQRLVSIAGALALSPDFLLIDEPYAGLDVTYGEKIRSIIEALCGEGKCIITVEG